MRPATVVMLGRAVAPPPPYSLSVAPSTIHGSSSSTRSVTGSFTATITGGTPVSITWAADSLDNASVVLNGGQGTTTANFTLTIVDASSPPSAGSCAILCTATFSDGSAGGSASMSATYTGPPL